MTLTPASTTLDHMLTALTRCRQGQASTTQLVHDWRQHLAGLPLPERYGQVLNQLLDRMESSALFTEESCSFSQTDQLASLQLWLEKARQQLANQGSSGPP
jgi:hypothetical protein